MITETKKEGGIRNGGTRWPGGLRPPWLLPLGDAGAELSHSARFSCLPTSISQGL